MSEIRKDSIIVVEVNDKEYVCQVAVTEEERVRGCMYVDSISDNEGMLFIYPEVQDTISYWMKDTPVHLDIVFISKDFEVISVKEGIPNDSSLIEESNVMFVLEVKYGSGIKEGDEVDIDDLEEFLEDRIEHLENLKSTESYKDSLEEEIDEVVSVQEILSSKGKVQYTLEGAERIFSRKNTKVLIRQAKKAERLKTDSAYKRLGKSMFKYLKIQDSNDIETVSVK